jgi:hypothetical protein
LTDYGLPSQQTAASQILSEAFDRIDNMTGALADSTNTDATTLLATAQSLYQTAYDLYNAGTYAQSAATARVAAEVSQIAGILDGDVEIHFGGMGDFGMPGGNFPNITVPGFGDGRSVEGKGGIPGERHTYELPGTNVNPNDGSADATQTPEEVPSPTFN